MLKISYRFSTAVMFIFILAAWFVFSLFGFLHANDWLTFSYFLVVGGGAIYLLSLGGAKNPRSESVVCGGIIATTFIGISFLSAFCYAGDIMKESWWGVFFIFLPIGEVFVLFYISLFSMVITRVGELLIHFLVSRTRGLLI